MENKTLLIIGAVGVGAYLLLQPNSTLLPAATTALNNLLPNILPTPTTVAPTPATVVPTTTATTPATVVPDTASIDSVPVTYGIGVANPAQDHESVANLPQLIAADPRQGNPNYVLNPGEQSQYLMNYADIRQGMPTWPGGINSGNIQTHWNKYGPAQGRIFLPLEPPSGQAYIPPPPNKKSSGHGLLRGILEGVTVVAGAAITVVSAGSATALVAAGESVALTAESKINGINGFDYIVLNDAEVALITTSAAVIKKILPFYQKKQSLLVGLINDKVDSLVSVYAP